MKKHQDFVGVPQMDRSADEKGRSAADIPFRHAGGDLTVLEAELQRLQEQAQRNESIFRIVSDHSDRVLYEYDILTGMTRPRSGENAKKDVLAHLYDSNYDPSRIEQNRGLIQDSFEDVKKFFADIHGGVPSGEMSLHVRLEDGQPKWYHFRYSSIFDGGKPVTAIISVEDITQRHEQELIYQHFIHSQEIGEDRQLLCIESDLTADKIEKASGQLLELLPEEFQGLNCRHSQLGDRLVELGFRPKKGEEVFTQLSRTHLLKAYEDGERKLQTEWQMYFDDGSLHWLEGIVTMIADPYSGHIRTVIGVEDVSKAHEEHELLTKRADYDAMTGLLRRDSGEEQIQKRMSAAGGAGGIMIVLDLDDLKDINDTLGHEQGDKALIGVANALKKHFRKDDVVMRFGGDEFIVFLPGAGRGVVSVKLSLIALLRKISTITVGKRRERTIHCSIGCSVEQPGADTFETLFRRADTALYHVKRGSKNNFAFYAPEMEQADYEYRSKKLLSVVGDQKFAMDQMQAFLGSMAAFYQMILSVNLRDNTYYIMQEIVDGVFSRTPAVGQLNDFVRLAGRSVHPDDAAEFFDRLSREGLLNAYQDGKETIHHHFRFFHDTKYRWIECVVVFYLNEDGDVCDFTMLRWADDKANELDRLYLEVEKDITARKEELNVLTEKISQEDVLFRCLNTLTSEPDIQLALYHFLELVGGYYQADRAYIIEFDHERQESNNTFEWCAPGVSAEMENLQNTPFTETPYWIEHLETQGEVVVDLLAAGVDPGEERYRILQEQDIQNLLAVALRRTNHRLVGFIGVDNPRVKIHDLEMLRSISNIILEELEKRDLMAALKEISYVDSLSGLHNRNQYSRSLLALEKKPPDTLGIIALDINGLREINDTYGLEYGDRVLKRVAGVLHGKFPDESYRIGGDEFVILRAGVPKEEFKKDVVWLRSAFDAEPSCKVSIGFSWGSGLEGTDVNTLRQQAQDMRHAEKQSYYSAVLREGRSISRVSFESEVIQEVRDRRFSVYYQPQVELKTGAVIGAEALVREREADGSLVPPGKFIPLYEMGGVVRYVDLFVLEEACADLRRWMDQGCHIHISVNFSRITLLETDIVESIETICKTNGVPPSAITIEVTESIGKMDNGQLKDLIEKLKTAGFRISLDDFGSQYSNLAILAAMDFDEVKFDRSLVSSLEENKKSRLVMESGLGLCRAMEGTSSLAEGIETEGQLEILRDCRCDYGQGYYFSKPLPRDEFDAYLKDHGALR